VALDASGNLYNPRDAARAQGIERHYHRSRRQRHPRIRRGWRPFLWRSRPITRAPSTSPMPSSRVRKVSGGVITTVAGIGPGALGAGVDNVPAVSDQIGEPLGIAVDSAGNLCTLPAMPATA
jgi:hypothetical protein